MIVLLITYHFPHSVDLIVFLYELVLGPMGMVLLVSILCSQNLIREYMLLGTTQYKNAHLL